MPRASSSHMMDCEFAIFGSIECQFSEALEAFVFSKKEFKEDEVGVKIRPLSEEEEKGKQPSILLYLENEMLNFLIKSLVSCLDKSKK